MAQMIVKEIKERLFDAQDFKYAKFQRSLIPNIDPKTILGVRTNILRKWAKEYVNHPDIELFFKDLGHQFFEENQLHSFIIAEIRDFDACVAHVEAFLPYVDNWATSDQLIPKTFKKNRTKLLPYVNKWFEDERPYYKRFAIGLFMQLYLEDEFQESYMEKISKVQSDEYYVNMMIAWYFATALAKQYDVAITYLEKKQLPKWVHNKTIQKGVESYRITEDKKLKLRSLRIK